MNSENKLFSNRKPVSSERSLATSILPNKQVSAKSRLSTMTFGGGNSRSTIAPNKNQDIRPVYDKKFQEDCFNKIFNFLIVHGYGFQISNKFLTNPSEKEFKDIFCFIAKKIRPDWNFTLAKLEDDLPGLTSELKYPFTISKNCLKAIGAPHSFPPLLALLFWMVETALYLEIEDEFEAMEENEERDDYDKAFEDFTIDSYKSKIKKGETTESKEKYITKVSSLHKDLLDKIPQKVQLIEEIKKEIEKVVEEDKKNDLTALHKSLQVAKDELDREIEYLQENKQKLSQLGEELSNEEKEERIKDEKIRKLVVEINETETILSNQSMSSQDYEQLKQTNATHDDTIKLLRDECKDCEEKLNNLKSNTAKELSFLKEKIKEVKSSREVLLRQESKDLISLITDLNTGTFEKESVKESFKKAHDLYLNAIQEKAKEKLSQENKKATIENELRGLEERKSELDTQLKNKIKEKDSANFSFNKDQELNSKDLSELETNVKKLEDEYKTSESRVQTLASELEAIEINGKTLEEEISETERDCQALADEYQKDLDALLEEVFRHKKENFSLLKKLAKSSEKMLKIISEEI